MSVFSYTCATCKNPFEHRKADKKFCSHKCYASRHAPIELVCVTCSKSFVVPYRARNQKACSFECSKSVIAKTLTKQVEFDCLRCRKRCSTNIANSDKSKYCSPECFYAHKWRAGIDSKVVMIVCEGCGQSVERPFIQRGRRFCSYNCSNGGKNNSMFGVKGENHPTFGQTPWCKGLTVETDVRLANMSKKISAIISQKMVDGTWSPPVTKFKTSHFESKKCEKTFYCRSSYEQRCLELLEQDDNVVRWESEPLRISYEFDGREHNYIPDILVEMIDGARIIVEVKPESLIDDPKNRAKIEAGRAFCSKSGYGYVLMSEQDLGMAA